MSFFKFFKQNSSSEFKSKKIGKDIWMIENLNVEVYKNGSVIPEAKTDSEWKSYGEKGKGCWCYYNNDIDNGRKYGKLYNWYAINPSNEFGGVVPNGWHVPSYLEIRTLFEKAGLPQNKLRDSFLNGQASKALKKQSSWSTYNQIDYNKTGWSGLPGGLRTAQGQFYYLSQESGWWSDTDAEIEEDNPIFSENSGWCMRLMDSLKYTVESASMLDILSMSTGLYVRCIRD